MSLYKGIKEIIEFRGREIIYSLQLINMLDDLQAYEFKASRKILYELIKAGYAEKIYNMDICHEPNRDLKALSYTQEIINSGFQRGHVEYVVKSILRALNWTDDEPEYISEIQEVLSNERSFSANGVTFTMRQVDGGKFSMGATIEQSRYASFDEKPSVDVILDDFYIGETPVTQELWNALMQDNPSNFKGANLPVERVTWDECHEFIDKLNAVTGEHFRLPTEAEWEFAARGGTISQKTKYAGTEDDHISEYLWYKENSNTTTHAVKEKNPNELGLHDMCGNVSEWCSDWYFNSYSMNGSSKNPQGPASGMAKVIRGGSWNDKAINCRVSKRNSLNPTYKSKQVGFRLVLQ